MTTESAALAPAWRRRLPILLLGALAALIVSAGVVARHSKNTELAAAAQAQAVPTVSVLTPSPIQATALTLPGRLEAWARAPLHARVDGYLTRWSHDIGEAVTAGQLLAEIDTPELDRELQQARAELARARGEAELAGGDGSTLVPGRQRRGLAPGGGGASGRRGRAPRRRRCARRECRTHSRVAAVQAAHCAVRGHRDCAQYRRGSARQR